MVGWQDRRPELTQISLYFDLRQHMADLWGYLPDCRAGHSKGYCNASPPVGGTGGAGAQGSNVKLRLNAQQGELVFGRLKTRVIFQR